MRSVSLDRKRRNSAPKRAMRQPGRAKREVSKRRAGSSANPTSRGILRYIQWAFAPFVSRPVISITAVLLVCAALGAVLTRGGRPVRAHALTRRLSVVSADAGFGISEIHISGNRRTAYSQVLAALGIEPGQSVFSADIEGARRRLASLDWVASAEVRRRYPGSIFVSLVEKRPFALWQLPGDGHGQSAIAVVERNGAIITTHDVEQFRNLPKLAGKGAPRAAAELIDAIQSHRAIAARVAVYERQSERRWNLILDDGVVVKLPESGWQQQLYALDHLIIDAGILERNVSEIDLRSPTEYFFVLRSGEKKQIERGKDT